MPMYTNEQKMRLDEEQLEEKLRNISSEDLPTANIIVAGIAGVGKSTLINEVFGAEDMAKTGKGRSVTEFMREYGCDGIPIRIWDTVGLELDSEKTRQSILDIKNKISEKAKQQDMFDRIHAIWYCIDSGSHRYQPVESNFVKELYSLGVPFIIVLTQCVEEQEEIDEFAAKIQQVNEELGLGDIPIVQVCAKEYRMRGFQIKPFGLDTLVDTTMAKLPNFIKSGFAAAQKVSKKQKRSQSEEIIYSYVRMAKYGFWERIPGINIKSANDHIMVMFWKIGAIYNTDISKAGLDEIARKCSIDWENAFAALITPFKKKYYQKVMNKLEASKEAGFDVAVDELKKNDRVAVMVAMYGYTYVEAIEEMWQKFTEDQLNDMDIVVANMVSIINRILSENFHAKAKG